MLYHSHSANEVLDELRTSEKGLHQIYAEARLKEYGDNHLRLSRRSLGHILGAPFASALMLILLAAFGSSIFIGNITETILIACIILLNVGLRYWQSISHERTLRSLESEATGHAVVRRDGIEASIAAIELVPGDIVVLKSGDRIPADGRILHSAHFTVNQLQLTGENEAISKHPHTLHSETELHERHNMVYRGTYVTSGNALCIVTATGNRTEYGKLLQRAAHITRRSSLQQKIVRSTHTIVMALLGATAILLLLGVYHGMPTREIAEYASSIIVAAVPAILLFAIAFVSTYGLHILRRHRALVRHTQAIESISLISTIVSDKTGMLTRDAVSAIDTWLAPHMSVKDFMQYSQLAVITAAHEQDVLDTALAHYTSYSRSLHLQPVHEFTFAHDTAMSGNLWHHGAKYRLAIKGSPEKILRLADLPENEYERAHLELQKLAAHGHQVLAIAWCELSQPISNLRQLPKRQRLHFIGFVAFAQQLKPGIKQVIATAQTAGVSVRMVTGDHVETAYSIARQLGIATERSQVLDARKLAVMSDNELARVVHTVTVFARTSPDQKHRLLSALRRNHIVAATGDSTDDIPALIQAHIGISSARSSLLARDASDMILLNNNFATIFDAIKVSRTTIGNIRRMFLFIITTNIAEMLLIASSLAFALAPAVLPSQLLWVNLVVSLALVLPLGLEPHSRHIMERRPVSPRAHVLPPYLIMRMCVLATTMALLGILAMLQYLPAHGSAYAQTIVFTMFVAMQIVNALSARSDHTSTLVRFRTFSPLIYCGILIVVILQIAVALTPLGSWLGATTINGYDLLVSSGVACIVLLSVSELLKWHSRRTVRRKGRSYA